MRKAVLRWIEEAEARSVQEFTLVDGAASQPRTGIVPARTRLAWFDRVRELVPRVA
jgi:hypothetical protein